MCKQISNYMEDKMPANSNADLIAEKCGISRDRWKKLKDHHSSIVSIYEDYLARNEELTNVAVSLSSFMQRMPGVHSVRWRIKSPEHLIAKICRKKELDIKKYEDISVENYREVVTDLIGMRALHLLKGDFTELHNEIISTWDVAEEPIAYLRNGDQEDLRALYEELGLKVENHEDGYRSIHYIILTNFTKSSIKCELQVRTIFEEGWSEIDHRIRYPEFTKEPLVLEFVNIFNRLSGAADEMGTFALKLAEDIVSLRAISAQKEAEASDNFAALEAKIAELEKVHHKNSTLQDELKTLRGMVEKTRHQERQYISESRLISQGSLGETRIVVNSGSKSRTSREESNFDAIRKYRISPESYSKATSISKKSILDSIEKRQKIEASRKKIRENERDITSGRLKRPGKTDD